ncbi:MAG: ribosome-associated translation inhibitor RaiA [Deltaproteobacteria bacterium]|nr:MAG: ribosome-associated translation inhibitor RaiA [Deltaproteobacteria bacterium]
MQISVSFRHMDPSPSLQRYAADKLNHVVSKYVTGEDIDSQVVFSVERFWHIANFTININGLTVKSVEKTEDMRSSVDKALDKVERQMRRYKDKIRDHKPSNGRQRQFSMGVFAVPAEAEEPEDDAAAEPAQLVKRETLTAEPMTTDRAIMQLELRDAAFFVFTNEETDALSIIYRRDDGTFGLIEPESEQG